MSLIIIFSKKKKKTTIYQWRTIIDMIIDHFSLVSQVFVMAACACAVLARPEADVIGLDAVQAAAAPTIITKRAAIGLQDPSSLPNVSEDVLEKALNDRRFVQRQLKCATGEGPCDPIGRKIKGSYYWYSEQQ